MILKLSSLFKPFIIRPAFLMLALAIVIPLLHLAGCASPLYYTQAISGHMAIMGAREDIDDMLDQADVDPELQRELELALEIRTYASQQLGLPANDSYTEFVGTGRQAVTWNVVAAPEFSIQPKQWCFVVSGCVTYRGYFAQDKAEKFAMKLKNRSLDVTVSPAIAYSTLGWFDDPLLDTMLQYSDEQLAAFIFHELAHQQLYVKGDTSFNEAYAGFVEEAGVSRWLQASHRVDMLPRWKAMEQASMQFNSLLMNARNQLEEEYGSGHSEEVMRANKKSIFSDMEAEYRSMVDEQWGGRDFFKAWFTRELNNAQLALASSYQGGVCSFRKLYESADRDIVRFHQLAAEKASLDKHQRSAWLNQPC